MSTEKKSTKSLLKELNVETQALVDAETALKSFDLKERQSLAAAVLAKARAEAAKAESEAFATAEAAKLQKLAFDMAKREDEKVQFSDRHNFVYRFNNDVNEVSVADCMAVLARWHRMYPNQAFEIVISSPGGSIIDGFALFDFIQEMKRKGHTITTKSIGYAASMAGVLLQAGTKRVMSKESWLLIHEASFGAGGKMGVVEDAVKFVKKLQERILNIYAERASKVEGGKSAKSVRNLILKNWKRTDWWISSEEALAHGFVDEVE